jgi:hypothetical protein
MLLSLCVLMNHLDIVESAEGQGPQLSDVRFDLRPLSALHTQTRGENTRKAREKRRERGKERIGREREQEKERERILL